MKFKHRARLHASVLGLGACAAGVAFAAGGASAAAKRTVARAAAKAPVSIMVESAVNTPIGSYPGEWGAAQAAALAINKAGGINGHHLNVKLCNDQFSVNGAAACARQAVSDHVIAYTGFSPFAFAVAPILKPAGIVMSPWISDLPDSQTPTIVPLDGDGALTEQFGIPIAGKDAGAKTVAFTETEYPGLSVTIGKEESEATHLHMKVLGLVTMSETQTDMSTVVQKLAALKPDAVLLNTSASQVATILQTANTLGFHPTWVSSAGPWEVSSLKDASNLTSKLWLSSVAPAFETSNPTIPAVNQYNHEMNAAVASGISNSAAGNRDDSAFFVWASTHALVDVALTVKGQITKVAFARAIKKAHNVNVVGLWKWTPSARGPITLLPHVTDGGLSFIGRVKAGGTFTISKRQTVLSLGGLG